MLDIRTIIISIVVTNFTSFLAILILHLSRFPVKGTFLWVVGRFFTSLGFLLVFFSGLLPDFFTVVIGNGLAIVGNTIVWLGMSRFVSCNKPKPSFYIMVGLFFTAALAGLYWYEAVNPSLWRRIVIITSSLALVSALTARDLIKCAHPTQAVRITGVCYAIHTAVMAACCIVVIKKHPAGPLMASPEPLMPFMYMYALVFGIVVTFAMILIISQELQRLLARQAALDPLTGIYNRRALHMFAEHDFQTMLRKESSMSVIMIDLDFFKKINDKYGHQVGDQMLVHFTEITNKTIRNEDLLFRYGGEEFVVLAPDADRQGALLLAERIREACSATPLKTTDNSIKFTVSVGLTSANSGDQDIYQVIDRADRALYEAKEKGRDRAMVYDVDN